VGSEGPWFSFRESGVSRIISGGTVFLSGSRDRDAFDRITAAPDRFLENLYDALDARDVTVSRGPTHQVTDAGPSMAVSGTFLFHGSAERRAFDVALFREGLLGVAIFYEYPVGDKPDPDIASVGGILQEKIAIALDPNAMATLPSYYFETATPYSELSAAGQQMRDSQCAVSFSVLAGWEAFPIEDPWIRSLCAEWGIRPTNWPSIVAGSELMLGDYAFSVAVVNRPLEDGIGFFELHSGQWFVSGRQGLLTPATAVQDRGLIILRGTGAVGMDDLHGSYVGLAALPRAAVSNGVRSAYPEAETTEVEPAFELVLQTLRFLEQ
jgi:hypothetical protein